MNNPEIRKIRTYFGRDLLTQPELLELLKPMTRILVKTGEQERSGFMGIITNFDSEKKILNLSSQDASQYHPRENFSISLEEPGVEITFL